jgi:hypothetical protein
MKRINKRNYCNMEGFVNIRPLRNMVLLCFGVFFRASGRHVGRIQEKIVGETGSGSEATGFTVPCRPATITLLKNMSYLPNSPDYLQQWYQPGERVPREYVKTFYGVSKEKYI